MLKYYFSIIKTDLKLQKIQQAWGNIFKTYSVSFALGGAIGWFVGSFDIYTFCINANLKVMWKTSSWHQYPKASALQTADSLEFNLLLLAMIIVIKLTFLLGKSQHSFGNKKMKLDNFYKKSLESPLKNISLLHFIPHGSFP